jgi:hypothetical protein
MRVCTTFPPRERDLRLDLFRGLANWAIFLDHIPHEVLSSITTRNYGFSDAADLFVFISGYTAALVNSLQVFCIGIVLSFCAHAAIETSLNSLWVQILVGTIGILSMTATAYCWTWYKRQDRVLLSRARIRPIYRDMKSVEEQRMRAESRWPIGRKPGQALLGWIFRGGMA